MVFLIILMTVGVLLILTEILLARGTLVAGISGIAVLAVSCLYAYIEFGTVAGTILTVADAAIIVVMMIYMVRARVRRHLETSDFRSGRLFGDESVSVGDAGKTVTCLSPSGIAEIGRDRMEVVSLEGVIDAGEDVSVVLIEEGKIYVKPSEEDF